MKKEIIKAMAKILLTGVLFALKGASALACICATGLLLWGVTLVSGYAAVGYFVCALLMLAAGLAMFLWCGHDVVCDQLSS